MFVSKGNTLAALTLRLAVPAEADEGLDNAVPVSIQCKSALILADFCMILRPADFRLDALLALLESMYSVLLRRSDAALAKLIFGTAAAGIRDLVGVVAFLMDPGVLLADWGRLPGRPKIYAKH
jgi:hypothetical protein